MEARISHSIRGHLRSTTRADRWWNEFLKVTRKAIDSSKMSICEWINNFKSLFLVGLLKVAHFSILRLRGIKSSGSQQIRFHYPRRLQGCRCMEAGF